MAVVRASKPVVCHSDAPATAKTRAANVAVEIKSMRAVRSPEAIVTGRAWWTICRRSVRR